MIRVTNAKSQLALPQHLFACTVALVRYLMMGQKLSVIVLKDLVARIAKTRRASMVSWNRSFYIFILTCFRSM